MFDCLKFLSEDNAGNWPLANINTVTLLQMANNYCQAAFSLRALTRLVGLDASTRVSTRSLSLVHTGDYSRRLSCQCGRGLTRAVRKQPQLVPGLEKKLGFFGNVLGFIGFLKVSVYKVRTKIYDPSRTSYTPFSLTGCHIVLCKFQQSALI